MDLTLKQAKSFQEHTRLLTNTYRLQIRLIDQLPNGDVAIVAVHRKSDQRKFIYYVKPSGEVTHVQ